MTKPTTSQFANCYADNDSYQILRVSKDANVLTVRRLSIVYRNGRSVAVSNPENMIVRAHRQATAGMYRVSDLGKNIYVEDFVMQRSNDFGYKTLEVIA